ncbi:histamine H4 receptor [Pyrgilauda ruficollis]|uniref:histamine H4 receptor n=1 Tax=Pyrgilauda ruficollis TaxID=221976 RepID=UPI001B864840|nr:histamine H4 receptor [Pyrgilauda ruficollis]
MNCLQGILQSSAGNHVQLCHQDGGHLGLSIPPVLPSHPDAFVMDRNLRHRSNYFFLNLAVSDFAVGVFCMPLYIPYALTGTWHLGRSLCKLWLVMDYLVCTASVFNIVLISYDRFLSVTKANLPGASSPSSEAEDSVSSLTRSWRPAGVAHGPSRTETSSTALKRDFSASFCSRSGSKLQRDKKIAKSLAIIVCVFAICWAPYSLLMIIRGACQGKCIHNSLYEATFWLLWINSSLNPFLYPLCHMRFRMAFLKILCPKKFSTLRSGSTPSV